MNFNDVTIRSRNPMYYIDDKYQIIELENTYDDEEVIEINNGCCSKLRIPINKQITIVPKLGMFFFRSKDDALMFGRMLDKYGKDALIKSAESQAKTKSNIMKISSEPVKNGMFSVEAYDKGLMGIKDGYCVITKDKRTVKIMPVKPGTPEDRVITEYINRNSKIEYVNLANNKIVFETMYENGIAYVTHYVVSSQGTPSDLEFISDLNSFRFFRSLESAYTYLSDWNIFGSEDHYFNMQRARRESYIKYQERKAIRAETRKKVFSILFGFVWGHKGEILKFGFDAIKNIKGSTSNPIEDKVADMILNGAVNIVS